MDALVVAFGAGLAAAASPCLLPLYPAFLAYLTSASGVEAGSGEARRISGLLGLAVLLGLLTSMTLIGLIVFAIAVPMGRILGFAIPFIDLLLVALGVMLLVGVNPFMRMRTIRVPGARGPLSQAFVYGMFLGPIALPCAGPFLVALLAISVSAAETVGALATFFAFGLGFGLPLVLLSLLARARQDRRGAVPGPPSPRHRDPLRRAAHRGRPVGPVDELGIDPAHLRSLRPREPAARRVHRAHAQRDSAFGIDTDASEPLSPRDSGGPCPGIPNGSAPKPCPGASGRTLGPPRVRGAPLRPKVRQ